MTADPKPAGRVRDPELLKRLHREWRSCALCGHTLYLSLHHIHKHPRDDVRANLVMLCGDGTTGCHGLIEHHDRKACVKLATHIVMDRLDTLEYLGEKLGSVRAVREWLSNSLHAVLEVQG